jgi:hypothetical protein
MAYAGVHLGINLAPLANRNGTDFISSLNFSHLLTDENEKRILDRVGKFRLKSAQLFSIFVFQKN